MSTDLPPVIHLVHAQGTPVLLSTAPPRKAVVQGAHGLPERVRLFPMLTRTGWVCVDEGTRYARTELAEWAKPEHVPTWLDLRWKAYELVNYAVGELDMQGPFYFTTLVDYDPAWMVDRAVLTLVPAASVRVIVHAPARMSRSHR